MCLKGLLLSGFVICATMAGCVVPTTSRTAVIKDITISEGLTPNDVLVHLGDEVRWVNLRKAQVQLDIQDVRGGKDLLCERGFTNWIGKVQESVSIKPNESVSLCFGRLGLVNYSVRTNTVLAGGQVISGAVKVAGH